MIAARLLAAIAAALLLAGCGGGRDEDDCRVELTVYPPIVAGAQPVVVPRCR